MINEERLYLTIFSGFIILMYFLSLYIRRRKLDYEMEEIIKRNTR